ncbi:MAG: hypothetical protein sL5_00960 [Candidatus Mesenet longicola]|uniref:Ankyrin repeat domain-containing protein n=1 Tax=Candidatus Mesenet longicola TaxID=1892558 RepID=A0A8J3MNM1_9RICK|nr:MAG: hypothetical protein sGL2_01400 [Candidatus Mesenet longicola]GHM59103.1 MAG: hypothetical protein sL5_00960 [Candidatus Mesenet longicola]
MIDCDRDQFNSNKKTSEENCNYTPLLHMAVACNSQEVVKALLENGADPNILDINGWTPLQVAVINNYQEITKTLLKHNAGVAIGNAPLHIAINRPSTSDVKVYTKDIGKSNLPVATATAQQISDQSNEEAREATQVIPIKIKNLAKIQLGGITQGYSDNAKIIQALLSHDTSKELENALINQSNRKWYYPIHLAVISENLDAAEVLLSDPRVDINAGTGINRKTALMLATEKDYYDMVKLLLNHGNIDHSIYNDYGDTAFEWALKNECSDDIIIMLWRDIERRIKNGILKDYSIKLVHDLEIEKRLDRIEAEYGIDIRSMVEFIYIPGLEGYGDAEYESDVSEESEISEHETLENQENEPELEMSDIEVEAGPAAKRQRRG